MSEPAQISSRFLTSMRNHFDISGPQELLSFLPTSYLDFRKPITSVAEALKIDGPVYMKAIVTYKATKTGFQSKEGKDRELMSITLGDGRATFKAAVFGNFPAMEKLKPNDVVFIYGKMQRNGQYLEMQGINFIDSHEQGRIVAKYKGKDGKISPITVAFNMATALNNHMQENAEFLCSKFSTNEADLLKKSLLPFTSLHRFFLAIHRPKDEVDIRRAAEGCARLNGYYAVNKALKAEEFPDNPLAKIQVSVEMLKTMTTNMVMRSSSGERNITLTEDQKRAIWNIIKDLGRDNPTRHLLMGDVGCGKTFAYMIPAVAAHLIGASVCILMPNTLLAQQVQNEIIATYPEAKTTLVIGDGKSKKYANPVYDGSIIIGTNAIINWAKNFTKPHEFDLVIIDEQQKIGMSHKNAVLAEHTNLIEASATPIPRTLAHSVYGDKQVSFIEKCPVEKDIKTMIIADDEKKVAMDKLIEWMKKGRQVAILYPLKRPEIPVYEFIVPRQYDSESFARIISDNGGKRVKVIDDISKSKFSDTEDAEYYLIRFIAPDECFEAIRDNIYAFAKPEDVILLSDIDDEEEKERSIRSVEGAFEVWNAKLPGKVIMIHGGMGTKAKLDAAEKAKSGAYQIIITSTVIEIGLTMPNLFCMLVVEADNLGASTLHQLRGRLVRLGGLGEFIMHTCHPRASIPEETFERLNILVKYKKGSEIADADMRLRGFGDLSKDAIRQSGSAKGVFPGMKITPQHVDDFLKTCLKYGVPSNETAARRTVSA
jgi:RecG-like helicase